jgi:hypothetical protein
MTIAGRITALLTSLTVDQLRALSRAERQLLSDQCERVNLLVGDAERAEAGKPKSVGVLARLGDGERAP